MFIFSTVLSLFDSASNVNILLLQTLGNQLNIEIMASPIFTEHQRPLNSEAPKCYSLLSGGNIELLW